MSRRQRPPAHTPSRPEHWELHARDADVATLVVPADAQRERVFEVACMAAVQALDASGWHEMRVTVDGEHEWSRRAQDLEAGARDSLDYRFRRRVAVGRPLRVTAHSLVSGARRVEIRIEADEA